MRVAAAAHDPGGANAVAATVAALRRLGADVDAYAKGPAIRQFERLSVACHEVGSDHSPVLTSLAASVVLVGTSEHDSFEREILMAARSLGIPTVALLDYWANYRLRFEDRSGSDALLLPDAIAAIDDRCAREMQSEGLPASIIHVTGQPYFGWLAARRQPARPVRWPPRRLFFASQPKARETDILRSLLLVLKQFPVLERLTVRFHPRQTETAVSLALLREAQIPFEIDESHDVLATLQQHDAVLGMTSVLLIEAAMMGLPTGSMVLGIPDTLATNQSGLTIPLRSPDDIQAFLAGRLERRFEEFFLRQQLGADRRAAELCRACSQNQRSD